MNNGFCDREIFIWFATFLRFVFSFLFVCELIFVVTIQLPIIIIDYVSRPGMRSGTVPRNKNRKFIIHSPDYFEHASLLYIRNTKYSKRAIYYIMRVLIEFCRSDVSIALHTSLDFLHPTHPRVWSDRFCASVILQFVVDFHWKFNQGLTN